MAYERQSDLKELTPDLAGFIEGRIKMYRNQLASRNAADEVRFQSAVLQQNLTLEDQLKYREAQLTRVADDPDERNRMKLEVAALEDRIETKKFSDAYLEQLIEFESGMSSLDSVLSWLRQRKTTTTDIDILETIQKSILTQETKQAEIRSSVMQNKTDFALKDKGISVIDDQIQNVSSSRAQAYLAGNEELITIYDLQLQNLNKARNETSIENAIKDFSAATMVGYSNATSLLDAYNESVSGAATDGAVTIGGTNYNSPQEFWTFKRDSYIADESENGFFSRLRNEQKTTLRVKNSQNILTAEDIRFSAKQFDNLASRPELQNFQFKITSSRQDVIQDAVDLRSGTIVNNYIKDLDVDKAFTSLNELKLLGGNVESSFTSVLSKAAEIKETQVTNILQATQDALRADPNLSASDAIDIAIAAGAGAVLSPEQAVGKTEEEIVREQAAGAEAEAFIPDPRTTVRDAEEVPPVVPQLSGEDLSKSGKFIKRGGDVFEAATQRNVQLEEFKRLNLNLALIPEATTEQLVKLPEVKPAPQEFIRPEGFAEVFVDGVHFAGSAQQFQQKFGFNPDDPKVQVIDPTEATRRGLKFTTRIS